MGGWGGGCGFVVGDFVCGTFGGEGGGNPSVSRPPLHMYDSMLKKTIEGYFGFPYHQPSRQ